MPFQSINIRPVVDPGGPPGCSPHGWTQKIFSLVPILNRYACPGLTILNSKFHRISRFEPCNFGHFCQKLTVSHRSMLPLYHTCCELLAVRTIAITFQLEHQKNTAGMWSSCRILHSSFQKIFRGLHTNRYGGRRV
jgi:hypothetical protein